MASTALPLELERNRLRHCFYLAIHCRKHGEIRAVLEELPQDRLLPCPRCHQASEYILLGEGGTLRDLPFWRDGQFSADEAVTALWRSLTRSRMS